MKPLVSIIIPVYNGEKYIDDCMESMLKQTCKNIEIIIVDDGSTDSSGVLCDAYAKKDNRIRVIHQENTGLSGARNAGIDRATGEYVYFCDIDDTVTENLIEDNVKLAFKHDADVVMFCFWYYDVDKQVRIENGMADNFVGNANEYFHTFLIPTMDTEVYNAPWNKMIKKSMLDENALRFNTTYPIYEDILFASELFETAEKIVVNKQMYYTYFVRSSGSLITRFYEKYFDSVTHFYKNTMAYCKKYTPNEKQIQRFSELYVKLVFTHLKQISCKADLAQERKHCLIQRICQTESFVQALKRAQLPSIKKRFMRKLILAEKYTWICKSYFVLNKLQGN